MELSDWGTGSDLLKIKPEHKGKQEKQEHENEEDN